MKLDGAAGDDTYAIVSLGTPVTILDKQGYRAAGFLAGRRGGRAWTSTRAKPNPCLGPAAR